MTLLLNLDLGVDVENLLIKFLVELNKNIISIKYADLNKFLIPGYIKTIFFIIIFLKMINLN